MPLTADRKYRYLSDAQAEFIASLVNDRFAEDAPERVALREQFQAIRSNDDAGEMIEQLKTLPTLAQMERAEREAQRPTEEGLYRNPETGELYRLKHKGWELIISKYSLTGGPRRLVADTNKIEKGKWKSYTAFQSRIAFSKGEIKRDWLIDAKDLAVEYAYGFCPLHFGPLSDAVSVILGYGPDCAEKHGLPWGEEYAQQMLAARQGQQELSV